MNYQETVDYLFSQLPMFQRVGGAAYKADLSNTLALCEILGNPQHKFKSIHIAGTNGKGSVSSTLASIFSTCGYKTGLFTSPHLKDYRERIKINGIMIPEEFVVDFVANFRRKAEHLQPSFFEFTCVMAFEYFAQQQVDIAILETGMGGRLDSTNVVIPEISVITAISLDHQQFLGDTIEKIALEKGGIIKPDVPVVIGENPSSVQKVFEEIAKEKNAPIYFSRSTSAGFATDLHGFYQRENMRTVARVIDVAKKKYNLLPACVEEGALNVKKNTGLRGRWEIISERPRIIADVAHNETGVKIIVDMLRKQSFVRLHIVWGMTADKDINHILPHLPTSATYYWCQANVPRAKNVRELSQEALKYSLEGKEYPSVKAALAAAKKEAFLNDLIFVGGSVFVVAEILD